MGDDDVHSNTDYGLLVPVDVSKMQESSYGGQERAMAQEGRHRCSTADFLLLQNWFSLTPPPRTHPTRSTDASFQIDTAPVVVGVGGVSCLFFYQFNFFFWRFFFVLDVAKSTFQIIMNLF